MKRRAYFHDYGEALSRSGGEATSDAMDYIESNLDYDEGLIYQNILRLCNQADLKNDCIGIMFYLLKLKSDRYL